MARGRTYNRRGQRREKRGRREGRGSLGRGKKGGKGNGGDKSPAWSSQDLGSTEDNIRTKNNKKAQLSLTNPRDAVKIRVRSLKVIESDAIQLLAYGFLLPSRSVL